MFGEPATHSEGSGCFVFAAATAGGDELPFKSGNRTKQRKSPWSVWVDERRCQTEPDAIYQTEPRGRRLHPQMLGVADWNVSRGSSGGFW